MIRCAARFASISFWCAAPLAEALALLRSGHRRYSFTRSDSPRSSSFCDDFFERLRTEVGDREQVVLGLLHELADRVDARPLEAVARPLRQVELLDREVEVGRRRGRRGDLTELEAARARRRARRRGRPACAACRPPTRARRAGVIEPSVSISRVSLSKFVACSTRVGSIENDTRRTGEKIASTGITPIVVVRLLRSADR